MLKNKFYRTLLVAGITGSLIISTGVVAFASSKSTTTSETKIGQKSFGQHKGNMQMGKQLESVLKTQVTAGTITQAESDAISSFITTKKAAEKVKMAAEKTKLEAMTATQREAYMKTNKPVRENIITELETANLLTKDQATKMQTSMPQFGKDQDCKFGKSEKGMNKGNGLASILKTQVTAKVITQAESDQATAFLKTKKDAQKAKLDAMTPAEKTAAKAAKKATRDAEKAKLDAMTPAEKTAAKAAKKAAPKNIFTELVTAGILTQDQVSKIQASMPQMSKMRNWKGQKPAGATTHNTSDANE